MTNSFSFLFMPDISGFTEFVHQTEVSHSKHIVSELLELLIDAQEMDLVLAEIEGDALFYYKHNSVPTKEVLEHQVERMFLSFQNHLKLYETNRICPCGACRSALDLKLKFIAHAGDIDFITVKDSHKPYGQSVIKLHRLLKNEVPSDEYLLISDSLKEYYGEVSELSKLSSSYDFGDVDYYYRSLTYLHEKVSNFPRPDEKYEGNPVVTSSIVIDSNMLDLIELLLDYEKRPLWNPGPLTTNYEKDKVNQVGTQHTCVINNQDVNFETMTRDGEPEELILGERTFDFPLAEALTTFYTLKPMGDTKTEFHVETYFDIRKWKNKLLLPLIKSKFRKNLAKSMKLFKKHALKISSEQVPSS